MFCTVPCGASFPLWAINKAVLHVVAKRAYRQICKYAKLAERVLDLGFRHLVLFVHSLMTPLVYVISKELQIIFLVQTFWAVPSGRGHESKRWRTWLALSVVLVEGHWAWAQTAESSE